MVLSPPHDAHYSIFCQTWCVLCLILSCLVSSTPDKEAWYELYAWKIPVEMEALQQRATTANNFTKYDQARLHILTYMSQCVNADPPTGDWYNPSNKPLELVRSAGKLLFDAEGMRGLHDHLVWAFVPRRYRREIEWAWDGIGSWQS
jgi:hypothetical protein